MRKSSNHGLPGYCRHIDNSRIDAINNMFFEGFRFSYNDRLFTKIAASGVESRAVV
jgi:hypothetical protein